MGSLPAKLIKDLLPFQRQFLEKQHCVDLLGQYLHFGGEAGGWWWRRWLWAARWWLAGHLQTLEEPREDTAHAGEPLGSGTPEQRNRGDAASPAQRALCTHFPSVQQD